MLAEIALRNTFYLKSSSLNFTLMTGPYKIYGSKMWKTRINICTLCFKVRYNR